MHGECGRMAKSEIPLSQNEKRGLDPEERDHRVGLRTVAERPFET